LFCKARYYLIGAALKGGYFALLANTGLGVKGLPGRNTLARKYLLKGKDQYD